MEVFHCGILNKIYKVSTHNYRPEILYLHNFIPAYFTDEYIPLRKLALYLNEANQATYSR